jgi:hypothetical protein
LTIAELVGKVNQKLAGLTGFRFRTEGISIQLWPPATAMTS